MGGHRILWAKCPLNLFLFYQSIAYTNDTGARNHMNTCEAYGNPAAGNTGRFQYTGQLWLNDAGVYHYKNRAYHPGPMRFLQADPIGVAGGINLYAYVGGDPINFTDPMGLSPDVVYVKAKRLYGVADFWKLSSDSAFLEAWELTISGEGLGGGAAAGEGNQEARTDCQTNTQRIASGPLAPNQPDPFREGLVTTGDHSGA